jgi:transposase
VNIFLKHYANLTRIRQRISNHPKFQHWLFRRVQEYVEYKLKEYSISFERVNAWYTSHSCSRTDCDCVGEHNRSDKQFNCVSCGYILNADLNAAKNIRLKFLATLPASRTCSSGKATSQLTLVSGDAHAHREFFPAWTGSPPTSPTLNKRAVVHLSERSRVG